MELAEYERIAAAEDGHWWYRATRALMRDLLLAHTDGVADGGGPDGRLRCLDAGCGPGGNGDWLREFGDVTGVDLARSAVDLAHHRHGHMLLAQSDVAALPFPTSAFDVVIGVTILNQVGDDRAVAGELARVLRPRGLVLVVEPAFDALGREHDRVVHTKRRYRQHELSRLLTGAGLSVVRATYAHSYLVPAAAALAVVERVRRRPLAAARSDLQRGPASSAIFDRLASLERSLLKRRPLPVGLSAIALARKPT